MPSFLFEQIITLRQTCNYYPGSGGRVGVKNEEGNYRAVQTQHYIVPVFLLALGVDYSIPPSPPPSSGSIQPIRQRKRVTGII